MKKDDENTKRDRFTFFRSYQEVIDKCGKDDQLKIYRSIAKFALDGEEPQFDNTTLEMMWILIRPILRKSEVRSDSGRTGGKNGKGVSRNKGNKNAEKQKQINSKTKAKQKQNNSDMDNGYMDNGYMDNGYMDNVSIETKETDTKKDGLSLSLSIDERKEAFRIELEQYREKYERKMLNDFFQYWTEPNESNTKMRFEAEKFWKLKSRLDAWKNRKF